MKEKDRGPGVKIPPPLLLLLCVLTGYGAHYFLPKYFVSENIRYPVGILLTVLGFLIPTLCLFKFKKAKTNVEPWRPANKLIIEGIYNYSRNPIYVGLLIVGLGISVLVNSLWMLLILIPFIFLLHILVIQKEEAYLESRFGDEYLDYKKKVRRWI